LNFFMLRKSDSRPADWVPNLEVYFSQSAYFFVLIIGVLLFGLIASYVFNREFQDNTLKSILTVPVNRMKLLIAKWLVVLIWIEALMTFSYLIIICSGFFGDFQPYNLQVLTDGLILQLVVGLISMALTMPVIFLAVYYKNFVPSIAFTVIVSMTSLILIQSKYAVFFPWTAALIVANTKISVPVYPGYYPYLTLMLTIILSSVPTLIYFQRKDIG
ncbi:MAG: ABC transporter permease, partial [Calditrichaeota bacterium]|nr:ABC transporter permease [Calditrichota bacterium]